MPGRLELPLKSPQDRAGIAEREFVSGGYVGGDVTPLHGKAARLY